MQSTSSNPPVLRGYAVSGCLTLGSDLTPYATNVNIEGKNGVGIECFFELASSLLASLADLSPLKKFGNRHKRDSRNLTFEMF
jgi:hypothetical protein